MKRILALLLVLAMSFGLFAGCRTQTPDVTTEPTTQATEQAQPDLQLEKAIEYLRAFYKNAAEKTPMDYTRLGTVRIGLTAYDVVWSTDAPEEVLKIVKNEDGTYTIDIDEEAFKESTEPTPYVLTATITGLDGRELTISWNHIVPAAIDEESIDILKKAYALAPGESMEGTYTVIGVIKAIKTPYDPSYKNITVTIEIPGAEDMPLVCYRLKGDGADKLAVGDTITVTGSFTNYNGQVQFAAGCILEAVESGGGAAPVAPENPVDILKQAYALAPGESLPYTCALSGVITFVDQAYSPDFGNITVTMKTNGYTIKCYRIKGDGVDQLNVNDEITVSGQITNYNGTIEFAAGSMLVSRVDHEPPAKQPDPTPGSTLTVGQAYNVGMGKDHDTYTEGNYYITGTIVSIENESYGNMHISDGTGKLMIYGTWSEDGNTRYDKLNPKPAVGDTVTLYGKIGRFGSNPQMKNAWIIGAKGDAPVIPDAPSVDKVTELVAGTPYRFGMAQGNLENAVYYLAGGMDGYYMKTTADPAAAINVYVEVTEGGYYFYTKNGDEKLYINMVVSADGAHVNGAYEATASTVYTYDTTLIATVDGVPYWFGTRNDKTYTTMGPCKVELAGFFGEFYVGSEETPDEPEQPEQPEDPELSEITADKAYKFGMAQGNLDNKVFYLKGGMDGYYMATTDDVTAAIDVYVEVTEGGYYFYTKSGETKQYINMVVSGTHVNGAYEAAASTVYTYDAENNTLIAVVNDADYWFGTRNDKTYTTMGPCAVSYKGFMGQFYDLNEEPEEPECKHTNTEKKGAVEATCTTKGYTGDTVCTDCGETITKGEDIPTIAHNFVNGTCSVCGEKDPNYTPEEPSTGLDAGKAYKFGMIQKNVSATDVYYLAGGMSSYYMATTKDVNAAIDVYVEATEGGYYFYTLSGETKLYINMVVSGTHVNGAYEATASTVYTYDAENNTLIAIVNNSEYWFGTRNDKTYTTVGPCAVSYAGFFCQLYPVVEENPDAPFCQHLHTDNKGAVEATCTTKGYTGDTVCTDCGETITKGEDIPAIPHNFVNGTCSACGEKDPNYTPEEPGTPAGGKADFNTIVLPSSKPNGDSSYTATYTTANGWVTKNSAIQCGGTADINPQFTVIGPDNTHKAVCLNGKVSAPGSITSPTLTGGISKLTMKYTKMFTDTKLSATITITDLTTGAVYTNTAAIEWEKNTKYEVETFEWVLETPITGDFTIVVVNDCPTGQTGNKDRMTILELAWEASAAPEQPECKHTNTEKKGAAEATCTTKGYTGDIVCVDCGETITKGEEIPTIAHNFANGTCSACGAADPNYTEPEEPSTGLEAGKAYKFGMIQKNVSATDVYYLAGGMSSYYMATTKDVNAAIDVYVEATEGGYYFYTLSGETKLYINMVVSGTHVNGAYEAAASTVYSYDAENNTLIAIVNNSEYWFGTRNDKTYTTVGPCAVSYAGFFCQLYPVAEEEPEEPSYEHVIENGGGYAASLSEDGTQLDCFQFGNEGAIFYNTFSAEKPEQGNFEVREYNGKFYYAPISCWGTIPFESITISGQIAQLKMYGDEGVVELELIAENQYKVISGTASIPVDMVVYFGADDCAIMGHCASQQCEGDVLCRTCEKFICAGFGHEYGEDGVCFRCFAAMRPEEPAAPAGGQADFDTITTTNSSGGDGGYTKSYTTTNGWVTVNSAIQAGGSTVINPQYPVVGPDNTHKAVCLNGKKTAPGSLTSPTLTGGISKLTLKYTKMFTDTKLSVTITITDLATGTTYTQTVARDVEKDADKYVVWNYEWVLETPVTGEFTIEVVNNCPSGSTSNKDRMTILELAWEGAVAAHEHSYTVTSTATCTADGEATYTCECGDSYTEEAPKLGHIDENLDVECDREGCTSKVAPAANSKLSNFTANCLGSKLSTDYQYYVEGTIVEVLDAKNGIFLIDDGTGETFYFRLPKNAEGVSHANWAIKLVLGDKVSVYGKINKYSSNTAPNGQFWPAIQGGVVTVLEQHPHDFTFTPATCSAPAYCACGQSHGEPLGCADNNGDDLCDDCGKNVKLVYEYIALRTDNGSGVHDATAYTYTWSNANFDVQVAKASGGNLYVSAKDHMRLYKGNQLILANKNGLVVKTITVYLTNATQIGNFEKFLTGYTYTKDAENLTITIEVNSAETLTLINPSNGSTTQIKGVEFGYEK